MRGVVAKQIRKEVYGKDYSHKTRKYEKQKDKKGRIISNARTNKGLRALYLQKKKEHHERKLK